MKSRQAAKAKTRTRRTHARKVKEKLPNYKAIRSFICDSKTGSLSEHVAMDLYRKPQASSDEKLSVKQSGNSAKGKVLLKSSLKKRKKKSSKEDNDGDRRDEKHSVDVSLDGFGLQNVQKEKDDVECWKAARPQKNLGSPLIVEDLSKDFSSLSIPETLKHHRKRRFQRKVPESAVSCEYEFSSKKDPCIIVAESINPRESFYRQKTDRQSPEETAQMPNQQSRKGSKKHGKQSNNSISADVSMNTSVPAEAENIASQSTKDSNVSYAMAEESYTDRRPDMSYDTSRYNLRFYSLKNKVLVIMNSKSKFCFTGKVIVKVLYGAVEVYGSVITAANSPTEVYSPRGHSNVAIQTSSHFTNSTISDIWSHLSLEGIDQNTESVLQADVNQCRPGMAVILLSKLENKLIDFLSIFYPFKLFPKIKNITRYSWVDPRRAEIVLQSNLHLGNCKQLIVDPCITVEVKDKMLNQWRANNWSCTLIAGGKNVGKSTATRYLINTLLPAARMVVLVDLDPGQSECTPPGCISYSLIEQPLLGPNFTHLKTPVYQLYIGDVNVTQCITRYIEAVKMLFNKLRSCPILSRLPIIVNTMGFTYGIGWDIAVFSIKLIKPSLVVQIMSEKAKNNFPNLLSKEIINRQEVTWPTWGQNVNGLDSPCKHELRVVQSQAERKSERKSESTSDWNMEPYQQRELALISYLSEIVHYNDYSTTHNKTLSLSINAAVPYIVPFSSLCISLPRTSVPSSHALTVINGNIVALCGMDFPDDSEEPGTSTNPRILARSPLCTCYGFGIVRGIDMQKEEIFINTPLSISSMQYVNCLVGCIPVPQTLLQLNQPGVPYAGRNNTLPTSREPRRGYFRMRYKQNVL